MNNFKTNGYGTKRWYRESKLHRENGPAIEFVNGAKEWYKKGKRHREDGPAIEFADGHKEWYKEGHLHREGGPAVEHANGDKYWFSDNIFIYKHISKNNILNKIYEETLNGLFINVEKENILYLKNKFNIINIERFLNEQIRHQEVI